MAEPALKKRKIDEPEPKPDAEEAATTPTAAPELPLDILRFTLKPFIMQTLGTRRGWRCYGSKNDGVNHGPDRQYLSLRLVCRQWADFFTLSYVNVNIPRRKKKTPKQSFANWSPARTLKTAKCAAALAETARIIAHSPADYHMYLTALGKQLKARSDQPGPRRSGRVHTIHLEYFIYMPVFPTYNQRRHQLSFGPATTEWDSVKTLRVKCVLLSHLALPTGAFYRFMDVLTNLTSVQVECGCYKYWSCCNAASYAASYAQCTDVAGKASVCKNALLESLEALKARLCELRGDRAVDVYPVCLNVHPRCDCKRAPEN